MPRAIVVLPEPLAGAAMRKAFLFITFRESIVYISFFFCISAAKLQNKLYLCNKIGRKKEYAMKRIILITGGQRSGKSTKAEELALSLSAYPVYVATAHIWDEEFRERVRRHQERRGPQWTNIEEEMYLSRHDMTGKVVVIDCVTLWLTNFFFSNDSDVDKSMELSKAEFDAFTAKEATYIFVTNEIGLGGVSENAIQRKFTDLEGWMNQYIASKADEVILMVSGIHIKIK